MFYFTFLIYYYLFKYYNFYFYYLFPVSLVRRPLYNVITLYIWGLYKANTYMFFIGLIKIIWSYKLLSIGHVVLIAVNPDCRRFQFWARRDIKVKYLIFETRISQNCGHACDHESVYIVAIYIRHFWLSMLFYN